MRNVFACVKQHRSAVLSVALQNEIMVENLPKILSFGGPTNVVIGRCFSTVFSSVHGERPSAEYAKLRKQSLESEFGHVLNYSSKRISMFYHFGPFLALYRAAIISFHVLKLAIWQFFVHDTKKRSVMFRETLIRLGPFYIKLGQALSTRPDILPPLYCQELAKLQDQIPPFPTRIAIQSIEYQLGVPVSQIFADISPEPIAAASLGQVYKAHLHSGELVAVKVQRPGMSHSLTLDALLFNMMGGQLKRFANARKDLLVAVNELVRHMFEEIDYILEGQNAERFASLYSNKSYNDQNSLKSTVGYTLNCQKEKNVKVPKIYWHLTRKAVLTMEWIDGIKLTDEAALKKAYLNRKELIDQGLYCSLRQLLEVGFFHADPHPGNLVAIKDGSIAYFDFGMMGDIPRHYRVGLIQVLVHFVNRDSLGLANDFLSLGFLPEGADIQSVSDALQTSFGDGTRLSQDFQGILNQLYDVMYEFNFSLPPDYALVIRALGSLEGTAKTLDPDFKVVESAYPFVIGRLLADPHPDMRKILRELLIRNDGSIRWNRLERLIAAISQQAETVERPSNRQEKSSNPLGWKSFDMPAVVSATEDLFQFILSDKGLRVRVFLVRDIIKAADTFLEDEVVASMFGENFQARETSKSEGRTMLTRVVNGFRYMQQAMKVAPDAWTAMLIHDHQLFHHFLKKINANLSYVQFELRAFRNQYDGTVYYGVVNNVADEQSKLGTKYTVPQIAFYKGIIEAIVQDGSAQGSISNINALNTQLENQVSIGSESQPQGGSSQVPAAFKNFSLSQKERTLEELVQDKWLCTTLDGNVGLGVRSFMDLRSWFRNNDVPSCDVCNEAGVKADLCPNESCTVRIHNYCLTRKFAQRMAERVCPGCGAKWKCSVPKHERVEEEDIPNGSSQDQPPPEPTMRKKLRSSRTGDVDTGQFGSSQTSTFMPEARTTRRSSRLTSASQS